jgi:hypothetical protein
VSETKTLPGTTLKKTGGITFVPAFVLSNSGERFFFQSHIVQLKEARRNNKFDN